MRMQFGAIPLVCWCTVSCADKGSREISVDQIDTPGLISLTEALAIANRRAAQHLASELPPDWKKPPNDELEYRVEDYDKSVSQHRHTATGQLEFFFLYNYRKPVDFWGHPAHFSIVVDRQTGDATLMSGH